LLDHTNTKYNRKLTTQEFLKENNQSYFKLQNSGEGGGKSSYKPIDPERIKTGLNNEIS